MNQYILKRIQFLKRSTLVHHMGHRALVSNAILFEKFRIRSNEDFETHVRKSKIPVIVDFFATWCNPCRTLTPRLEKILAENEGKVTLAFVDIDENTDLALDFKVGAVPILLAVKNGKVQQRLIGLQDTVKLREWVENVLAVTVPEPESQTESKSNRFAE